MLLQLWTPPQRPRLPVTAKLPHSLLPKPTTQTKLKPLQLRSRSPLFRGKTTFVLPRFYRQELYDQTARLQPQTVIMMNNGIMDGSVYPVASSWPSDLIAIERFVPNSLVGHVKWREIEGKKYYMPGEVCDPIGKEWFFTEEDQPRSDGELLGMYLLSVNRGANLLLDVGPDRHGLIPEKFTGALRRLRKNIDKSGF
jgi:alpha-L-fucosidase